MPPPARRRRQRTAVHNAEPRPSTGYSSSSSSEAKRLRRARLGVALRIASDARLVQLEQEAAELGEALRAEPCRPCRLDVGDCVADHANCGFAASGEDDAF